MDKRSKKIYRIREIIKQNTYPPSPPESDINKWEKVMTTTNCYAYALDVPIEDQNQDIWIPGCPRFSSGDVHIYSGVTKKIEQDLQFLGVSYREDNGILEEGEYRIAIYFRSTPHDWPIGFHVSRQDNTGRWSEKKSWDAVPSCIRDISDKPPDLSEHGFVLESVLILSKN